MRWNMDRYEIYVIACVNIYEYTTMQYSAQFDGISKKKQNVLLHIFFK